MPKKISFYLIFFILTITSCKSKMEVFKIEEYKKPYISFGTGGGFTGKVTNYVLTEDGNIYTKTEKAYDRIMKISKKQAQQIYNNYAQLGLENLDINDPGNKYYFIEKMDENVSSKITWGNSPLENKNVDIYYSNLMQLIKNANNTKK